MRRTPATGALRVLCRSTTVRWLGLALACYALGGCGTTTEGDLEEPESPPFFADFDPPVVHATPGQTVSSIFEITGLADGSTFLDVDPPAAGSGLDGADLSVDRTRDSEDRFAVRIDTTPGTRPGVYRYVGDATLTTSAGIFERTAELTLIVMGDGSEPASGAIGRITAGDHHSLAIDADGGVWAWGRNDHGQLGDGTETDRAVPVPVAGLPGPAVDVAAGSSHSLALLADGRAFAWGDNEDDQVIPDGPRAGLREPTLVVDADEEPVTGVDAIAAGNRHSMAMRQDGTLYLWGANEAFALAGRSAGSRSVRVELPFVDAVAIAAGGDFSLAVADDGSAWGWGDASRGQLGSVPVSPLESPFDIGFVSGVVGVGAGLDHTLLLLDDGNIGALGRNGNGQLGDGSLETPIAQPTRPPFLLNVVEADGGALHSLALQQDREVLAWGDNSFGQVSTEGNQTTDGSGRVLQRVPVALTLVPPSAGIAAGFRHSLSIDDACGQVWAWGDDSLGQLGSGRALRPGGFRAEAEPVVGLGEATLPSGCPVRLTVASFGPALVSASGTPIQDADCSVEACTVRLPVDTVVSLEATSDTADFMGWGGSCAGAAPTASVTLDRSRSCVANFNQRPIAGFTASDDPVRPGFLTALRAEGSYDPDGSITSYEWDFDDDGVFDDTGDFTLVDFPQEGVHPVTLRVTDDRGSVGTTVVEIVVARGPRAVILVAPESLTAGQTGRFEAETDPDIVLYEWDVGGDGTVEATGPVADLPFPTAGDVVVLLRVTDADGLDASRLATVEVRPAGGGTVTITIEPDGAGNGTVLTPDGSLDCAFAGSSSTPSPCTLTVPAGRPVDLFAFEGESFFFSHWGVGDCDAQPPGDPNPICRLTPEADRTVRVSFE